MHTIHTNSVQETEAVGRAFATRLHGGCVVALFGGMGMGKTAFVRGLAQGLGIDAEVTSPTFALVHEYGGSLRSATLICIVSTLGTAYILPDFLIIWMRVEF